MPGPGAPAQAAPALTRPEGKPAPSPTAHAAPSPIGRLAPSPTGRLHLGHAWAFLLAWWSIRSRSGSIGLRLEDLDTARVKEEYVDGVLRDLEWLGLDWDGPVLRQSESRPRIEAAARQLEARGSAFACVCSRGDVRAAVSAPHQGDRELAYPGTCRGAYGNRRQARERTGKAVGLRFHTQPGPVVHEDLVAGSCCADPGAEAGDFLIVRRDGTPAYQLAVVVDDAAAGVSEVLRGEDLLASTARQLLLQRALGLPHPRWAHVPLVVDEAGRRLAKRHDDLALAALREAGADPRAVVTWVARQAGQAAEERSSAAEVARRFRLEQLPRRPVQVNATVQAGLLAAR